MARKPATQGGTAAKVARRSGRRSRRASGRRSAAGRAAAAKRRARRSRQGRPHDPTGSAKKTAAKRKPVQSGAQERPAARSRASHDARAAPGARKRWPRPRRPADRSRGPTNPMPTKRSTGTAAGAGDTRRAPGSSASGSSCAKSRKPFRARPPAWTWIVTARPHAPDAPTLRHARQEHNETSPALTGGDVDADWEDAYAVGDEAPGRRQPDARPGSRRRHRQGARRRVPGQRGAQGRRQDRRARQAPLGARPRVVGGLHRQGLTTMRDAGCGCEVGDPVRDFAYRRT